MQKKYLEEHHRSAINVSGIALAYNSTMLRLSFTVERELYFPDQPDLHVYVAKKSAFS